LAVSGGLTLSTPDKSTKDGGRIYTPNGVNYSVVTYEKQLPSAAPSFQIAAMRSKLKNSERKSKIKEKKDNSYRFRFFRNNSLDT
jgi:hypothetical protein